MSMVHCLTTAPCMKTIAIPMRSPPRCLRQNPVPRLCYPRPWHDSNERACQSSGHAILFLFGANNWSQGNLCFQRAPGAAYRPAIGATTVRRRVSGLCVLFAIDVKQKNINASHAPEAWDVRTVSSTLRTDAAAMLSDRPRAMMQLKSSNRGFSDQ